MSKKSSITATVKTMIKRSPLYPFILPPVNTINKVIVWTTKKSRARLEARVHRVLHNENPLFYTLSPSLLPAIAKAFEIQRSHNLLDGHGYYEFGLFKGFSFWFAEQSSRECTNATFRFYGFDSFEGVPESQVDIDPIYWAEGNYAASYDFVIAKLKEHGADLSRMKLYKGFFSESLFSSLRKSETFPSASICVIDSDLYESCVEVLSFIKDYLVPGSLLLFDDYNAFDKDNSHGERRALIEFEEMHPTFRKEFLFNIGWHGVVFRVLSL
ncbi:MAG: hypothetical protein HY663_05570 [Chloroflexi bacterium]|nr:hypothetical protein [Chloroflexota bacterium]